MRVMAFVKATDDSEKGFKLTPETTAMVEAMGKFNDELIKAGIRSPATATASRPHRMVGVSRSTVPTAR
jgi:hypothetical protein